MTVRIYHNPRCSKSRETLALIRDKGVEPVIVPYMDEGLSADDLKALLKKLKMRPAGFIRRKEALYKELGLEGTDEPALINAMAEHPRLIERPIVVNGAKAALGRPPEAVLAIL